LKIAAKKEEGTKKKGMKKEVETVERKKALIDASCNRFGSWNDPAELPAWFLDDEVKYDIINHNYPVVPHALVEQSKNKYQLAATDKSD
jgi:hypothetical protein